MSRRASNYRLRRDQRMAAMPISAAGNAPNHARSPGASPVAGVETLVPALCTAALGDGETQPFVNAQDGSPTLVGVGDAVGVGVVSGGGVENARVESAAGTARTVTASLCQLIAVPPHARFVAKRVARGAGRRHLQAARTAGQSPDRLVHHG